MQIKNPDNYELNQKIGSHILSFRNGYFTFWDRMYNHLKNGKNKNDSAKNTDWFGDMDFVYELIHDKSDKKGFTRAFYVRNTCTTSDENAWIVIHTGEYPNQEGKCLQENLHVRIIYPTSRQYPRKQYPDKLNLKFWKDRNYVCEYVAKYHMTNLGSVYGDIRDNGYVISYEKSDGEMDKFSAKKDQSSLHYFLNPFTHFTSMLHSTECQLDEK